MTRATKSHRPLAPWGLAEQMGGCRHARTTKTLAERQTFTQSADAGDRGWNVSVCACVCLQPRINTREKKQKTKQKHTGQQPWRSRVREIFPCFYDITCNPPPLPPLPGHITRTHAQPGSTPTLCLKLLLPSFSPLLFSCLLLSPLFCSCPAAGVPVMWLRRLRRIEYTTREGGRRRERETM